MNEQITKKRGAIAIAVVAALVIALIAYMAFMNARYTQNREHNDTATSDEFYFTSDILTNDSTIPVVYLSNETAPSITIQLRNYEDDLRYTKSLDIPCTLTVYTVDASDNPTTTTAGTVTPTTGNIEKGAKHTQDMKVTGLTSDTKYYVKAVANTTSVKGNFQKELTRKIIVSKPDKSFHASTNSTIDSGAYIEVTVWNTGNSNKSFTINYPKELTPDNSDSYMSGWTNANASNTGSHDIAENECHVFHFFKSQSTKITQSAVDKPTESGANITLSVSTS